MAMKKGKKSAKSAKKASAKKPAMKAATKAQPMKVDKAKSVTAPRNSSTKSFTYSEFIENIRGFCGLPKRSHAKEMCEDIARFVRESLRKGYKIPLLGLGKIYVRESKARMGRNPATGEMIQIPARKRVRFTAAKALKDAVLR
ncbi:MAG: HU family DNA-binding protein [Bdellovibrionota bacterium]|nr:MAG: HU family DNA-binding protein [Bdellovibrionota bacterium]